MTNYQVVWRGPVLRAGGLGTASREYVLALHRLGVDVKVERKMRRVVRNSKLTYLMKRPYARNKRKILIYHNPPSTIRLNQVRNRFHRIILNTVWETTKIPRNWFPNINKFDAVCVPSRQNVRALRNSGVRIPIFIVPHGVHSSMFTPYNKKLWLKNTAGKFVFVSVFGFQHRKNPETLLRAYWEEFSPKDKVVLVIKTSGYRRHETHKWIKNKILRYRKKLGFHAKNTAPIILLPSCVNNRQLKGIYRLGNAFVLPTRGEGVGLPFLESLASGVPVIATGWGGHRDFLHAGNSFLVAYKLMNPALRMNSKHTIARTFRHLFAQKGQLWAEADIRSLKRQMRFAYRNPGLCKKKGMQGRNDVRKLSWNRAGIAMKRAVEKVIRAKKHR
jgi:glycosyltransferase involved in cell wall biosynthesis